MCLAVNGPRKRGGPLTFVTGRAVENLLFHGGEGAALV